MRISNISALLSDSYQNFQYIAAQIQLFQFNQEGKRAKGLETLYS